MNRFAVSMRGSNVLCICISESSEYNVIFLSAFLKDLNQYNISIGVVPSSSVCVGIRINWI